MSILDSKKVRYCCVDCQANDYDGWHEKNEELPLKVLKDDHREAVLDKCTRLDDPVMPDLPSVSESSDANYDDVDAALVDLNKQSSMSLPPPLPTGKLHYTKRLDKL